MEYEGFEKLIKTFVNNLDNLLTLDIIRSLDKCSLDFDTFHFIAVSKHVIGMRKVGEGFLEDAFIDVVELQLEDNSTVEIALFHDSFNKYEFLKENEIAVDTVECINTLQELVKDRRFVANLRISAPSCFEMEDKEYHPKQLWISALECGGCGEVDYDTLDEVSQETIDRIP